MNQAVQDLVTPEMELLQEEKQAQAVISAVDPALIATFVSIGINLFNFAKKLFAGETGGALNDLVGILNTFDSGLINISADLQRALGQIDVVIQSQDLQMLAQLAGVHSRVMEYISEFPNGVPQIPPSSNNDYDLADMATAASQKYFQDVASLRGPLAFMPSICHATNSRLEVAVSAWPCWYVQSDPKQPDFNTEVNKSSGVLSSNISSSRQLLSKEIFVKPIQGKLEPDLPITTIGYQVIDTGKVVWTKMDPGASAEAQTVKKKLQSQRQQERLKGYLGNLDRWVNMSARHAPQGIARALDLGDANMFLRYVNPASLVMEEPEPGARALGFNGDTPVYRALPMRDILLDMLTSKAMRDRHGLLVKGADRRAVSTWFEKTFRRQPSPNELNTLVQVAELFGNDAFFGCLAYSSEYKSRFGDGLPSHMNRPVSAPAPVKQTA